LEGDKSIAEIYPSGYALDDNSLETHFNVVKNHSRPDSDLIGFLTEQQKQYGWDGSVEQNLQRLSDPGSRVVVTGQQPDLMGGPLLIIHKALTCIALASELEKKLQVPVIPLFWIAGDDSDLREVNYLEFLDEGSELKLDFSNANQSLSISRRILTKKHIDHIASYSNCGLDAFSTFYQEGSSLSTSFGKVIHSLFKDKGLIMVDGYEMARFSQDILHKFVHNQSDINYHLLRNESRIKAMGYHPQVKLRDQTARAFLFKDGVRERVNNQNSITGKLTHDVLSRPIVCDSIFPTIAHVLGPAEFNYFGLLSGLYKFFKIPFPLIAPRCHATLHRKDILSQLKKLDLTASDANSLSEMLNKLGNQKAKKMSPPLQRIN